MSVVWYQVFVKTKTTLCVGTYEGLIPVTVILDTLGVDVSID